jgi:hypothetical protein
MCGEVDCSKVYYRFRGVIKYNDVFIDRSLKIPECAFVTDP